MPRANRHHIPGQIWHITHRCHQREFLFNQFSYTYGVNNRLIAVADSAGNPVAGYVHNGKGERVSKTVNGVTTFYLYDESGNLLGEYNESGGVVRV